MGSGWGLLTDPKGMPVKAALARLSSPRIKLRLELHKTLSHSSCFKNGSSVSFTCLPVFSQASLTKGRLFPAAPRTFTEKAGFYF